MALIASWIVAVISSSGYLGILGLMALESACIPLPSEIIMPFSGYLVTTGRFSLVAAATAGALGCNLGSAIAYAAGASGGRKAVTRWGRYILFSQRELEAVDRFFARFGAAAALIGRLLPVVRTYISVPAGIARMPFLRFQIYTFVGSWPWCFALAYLGMKLGQAWDSNPTVKAVFHRFDLAVAGLLVLGVAVYVVRRWREARG